MFQVRIPYSHKYANTALARDRPAGGELGASVHAPASATSPQAVLSPVTP
jgi:hypothetical protein